VVLVVLFMTDSRLTCVSRDTTVTWAAQVSSHVLIVHLWPLSDRWWNVFDDMCRH